MARLIRNPHVERAALKLKNTSDWIVAKLIGALLKVVRLLPPERSTAMAERIGRRLAPILPRSKLARKNLRLAFPEKSDDEIETLLRGVWGNVARGIAEYVFLDQLFDFDVENPTAGRIEVCGIEQFVKLRDSGKPVIIFTGHTGNFEILPIAAAAYDLNVTAMFRPPNNRYLAEKLMKARSTASGHLVPSRVGAAWSLARILDNNEAVGLLADQAFTTGPRITFFGREASANPVAAKLARQYDCDIHPARCVRLPEGRFRLELHEAIDIPRTANGDVDVLGTTERINAIIEGWVREEPEQWLWLHDRWKIKADPKKAWREARAKQLRDKN
ncbi:lipid A biosynthesis lauroyl acyltransferase [Ahrensia sp. R2A130]|uniref:lipid A biosynthesis lauroyl acyltransferase n=1 Tax=Ahrensia sp. R2A130 TaxID=744979 RepID=UPI0001E0AC43|nr:lipid A biosynthesis lauroyl acyltransferase [Ahrensia sp. R2A130]EFL90095.1 lipid A biosynthesis lauroyl acyltransferase [Ahrensia sp. R2A130]